MAVHRPDRLVGVRDRARAGRADELAVQLGDRVADGVGDVDRRRALGDHRLEHAAEEVRVGAVAVLGRELDVAAQVAREAGRQPRLLEHLLAASCAASSPCAGRWWRGRCGCAVDSPPFSASAAREMSRSLARASEQTVRVLDRLRDRLHGLEVAVRRRGEAGLDHVDLAAARAGARCAASRPWSSRRRAIARRRARWCRR